MEKWFLKQPSVVSFDDRLQYYYRVIDEVDNLAMTKDQDCVRLHMAPLARAISQHAKEWIKCYGQTLQTSAQTGLAALKQELDVCILFIIMASLFIML